MKSHLVKPGFRWIKSYTIKGATDSKTTLYGYLSGLTFGYCPLDTNSHSSARAASSGCSLHSSMVHTEG